MVRVPEGEGLLAFDPNLLRVVVDDLDLRGILSSGDGGELNETIEGDAPVPQTG